MNFEGRAQARGVVAMKPPDHPNLGKLLESGQVVLVFLVQNKGGFASGFPYPADGMNREFHCFDFLPTRV